MRRLHALIGLVVAAFAAPLACGVGEIGPADSGDGGASSSHGHGSTTSHTTHSSASASGGGHPDAGPHDAGAGGGGGGGAPMGRDLSPDRTKFFGASRCAGADVLLCEDFESGTLDAATWSIGGDAPTVETGLAARGTHALHVKKHGSGASYIRESKTFPVANDTYFGRMFVYFVKLPSDPGMTYSHWTFAAASGTDVSGEIRLSGQLSNQRNLFGVGTDNRTDPAGTGDWTSSDADPGGMPRAVPTGEWACIEWMHAGGATNETRFFWDATEHPSLATTASTHGGNANPYILPTFTNVWVGWQEYQDSDEDFEMWVDEIAIDTARIGCVL